MGVFGPSIPTEIQDFPQVPSNLDYAAWEITVCRTCGESPGWVQTHPEPAGGEDPRRAWSADHYETTGHPDHHVWHLDRCAAHMMTVPRTKGENR